MAPNVSLAARRATRGILQASRRAGQWRHRLLRSDRKTRHTGLQSHNVPREAGCACAPSCHQGITFATREASRARARSVQGGARGVLLWCRLIEYIPRIACARSRVQHRTAPQGLRCRVLARERRSKSDGIALPARDIWALNGLAAARLAVQGAFWPCRPRDRGGRYARLGDLARCMPTSYRRAARVNKSSHKSARKLQEWQINHKWTRNEPQIINEHKYHKSHRSNHK